MSIDDAVVELGLAVIDGLEHARGGEELEGAGHRKQLVRPVLDRGVGPDIENHDAQAPAIPGFERFDRFGRRHHIGLARPRRRLDTHDRQGCECAGKR